MSFSNLGLSPKVLSAVEAAGFATPTPIQHKAIPAAVAGRDVLGPCRRASAVVEEGLVRLKELPFVARVRGEKGGMVWGIEMRDHAR